MSKRNLFGMEIVSDFGRKASIASMRGFARSDAGRLFREMPARSRALQRKVVYTAATRAHSALTAKIPKGDAWKEYKRSLEVAEIEVGDSGNAFIIRANPRSRSVRNIDEPDTVLYIRSRRKLKRVKPEVQILEKYNPWTLKTLPFVPNRTDALVVSRKVTKREVDRINKKRLQDRHLWKSELGRAGVRPQKARAEQTVVKTIPDVAFEATRLEFGIGRKPEPHWRPAISGLVRGGIQELARDPAVRATITKPNFTGWKLWEKIQTKDKIREGDARKYVPFQRRLGIRVSR